MRQGYTHEECSLLWNEKMELGYALQVCQQKGYTPSETQRQIDAFKATLMTQRRDKGFM